MPSEKDLLKALRIHSQALAQSIANVRFWHQKALSEIDREHQVQREMIQTEYARSMKSVAHDYESNLKHIQTELADLETKYSFAELGWESPQWSSFTLDLNIPIPRLTRFGWLRAQGKYSSIEMPALMPIIGSKNVLIEASGAGKDRARALMQSMILRLLVTLPPGKLRLICVDPVGLGSTVAGFIKGLPDILTDGYASFEESQIDQRLADLETKMANIKQKYLGVSFATMEEYNAKAGQVEEPYRLLVIADFPARFSDAAAQRLISIATNGPGTGVYMLAMVDADMKMPYNFNLGALKWTSSIISCNQSNDVWADSDFQGSKLTLDVIPSISQFEWMVRLVGEAAVASSVVKVPFSSFALSEAKWWAGDSRAGMQATLGQFGARETQIFTIDEKLLSSALVIGKTGSGKSTLLHGLIIGLVTKYSPNDLELYLLDFKQVEFMDYAREFLPHAKVVAVKSEREFGLSVLRGLDAELQRRKDLFGVERVSLLSDYRIKTSKALPRILLIADEFQELFSYDDALATEVGLILDRLVRQGRAFGINVLLASQTLAGANSFSSATKNQIPIRIALQCSDADSRLVLSDENNQARLLERPGEAIYNAANGRIEGNNRFQVFFLDDKKQERIGYLKKLRSRANADPIHAARKPIIFDGDSPAHIDNNRQLAELINAPRWIAHQRHSYAWLGEPIEIKDHTAALLRRQSGSNILIVGQNEYEQVAVGMLLSATLSLVAQHRPGSAHFMLFNLLDADSQWMELLETMAQVTPHNMITLNRRKILQTLQGLETEVARRAASQDDKKFQPIYLIFFGLHRARDLRREEGYYATDPNGSKPPAEQLKIICREGPDLSIHSLMWCDTYSNLERVLDLRPERFFDLRVAMQMNGEDSRRLLDNEMASKIGPNRALFFDEERAGSVEKFRPYDLPTKEWIVEQGQRLRAKQ
ncbi:MAG: hypothetical protein HZC38_15670 [Chloroflexi bacterium]|nr:hypothetical protein [Chloroflexota bacterium]